MIHDNNLAISLAFCTMLPSHPRLFRFYSPTESD
jgi:hypothetical protein